MLFLLIMLDVGCVFRGYLCSSDVGESRSLLLFGWLVVMPDRPILFLLSIISPAF